MTVSKLVIFCSSGHAKVIIDIIESNSQFELVGLIDNQIPKGQKLLGYEILGNDASLPELMQEYDFHNGIIGGGSVVNKDVKENSKYFGIPAKFVSNNEMTVSE